MPQFDVYANPGRNADLIPLLLDVQSDLLDPLDTRLVAPLVDATRAKAISRLNPEFIIEGRRLFLSTQEMSGYPRRALGEPLLNLSQRRDEILAAIDFLIHGF
ncbi:MAG: CcdB family protein [Alphaproteobacteria bacterium]|jgi:toxin CcdB|nr:CcdB family protein [Alphaproteobacteria bacterium]